MYKINLKIDFLTLKMYLVFRLQEKINAKDEEIMLIYFIGKSDKYFARSAKINRSTDKGIN